MAAAAENTADLEAEADDAARNITLGFPKGVPFDQHVRANVVTLHSHGLSVAAITL